MLKLSLVILALSFSTSSFAKPNKEKMGKRKPDSVQCRNLNAAACQANSNCEFYPGTIANDRPDLCLSK